MQTNDILLDVRNVYVDYLASNGNVHAVRDVSFTLKRGEILGLAGESGSGKSTLAFAIARLLRPPALVTDGEIFYYPGLHDGRLRVPALQRYLDEQQGCVELLSLNKEQLRLFRWNEFSVVFQSAMNALNPVMTIGNQLMDVFNIHRPEWDAAARKKRAKELLQVVRTRSAE
ncbi:hypothetical protein KDK_54390 [Dictyobacter kobayashii]|uniref:ABC transporter domain-containing protein n=1 Tax=Dictyobacter kobayashii TaxID=2014872 RepID=A0A402ARC7_9CHLR|nr:ATP-binding cassette domain-containing protein [Dictyobacter kobayashii]GCE21639.1 hypothetical protein KDK_54390 [Dictyobacter kobayashii]